MMGEERLHPFMTEVPIVFAEHINGLNSYFESLFLHVVKQN